MKRLDLIFSERELDAIIKTLEKANVPGYTVMKHATGRGPERVVTEDMEFTGYGSNAHVIVFTKLIYIGIPRTILNGKVRPSVVEM